MKRRLVLAAVAGLLISWGSPSAVLAAEAEETGWRSGSEGWQYEKEDGTLLKNCWQEIDGHWYYFDREGYMASGWTRIGGNNYCFRETGELEVGWRYNGENEKWYYFNEDGTIQKGWLSLEGDWYWFSSKGEMVGPGFKSLNGKRYYFFEDGKMASNQYIGFLYMDDNGWHDSEHDIEIEGKVKARAVSDEDRDMITEALKDIPRPWIKYFVDHGWEILYYPEKSYFSAPQSGGEVFYVYHKLDTSYKKIKFCKPEALTQAFGEYIGYAVGCYSKDSPYIVDLTVNEGNVDDYVEVPAYYSDDFQFYFGKLVEAYLDESVREEIKEDAPGVYAIMNKILYEMP